ncbi:MAG: tandem-95 repeat protein, partial [Planctomycetes bacterium]|nr:tandem-95 repeat protein [Planctomycetota bacterium]
MPKCSIFTTRYSIDGSAITPLSPIYEKPIKLATTTTLRSQSFLDGVASAEVSVTYIITGVNNVGATPVFSPLPGSFTAPTAVTITSTTPGTTLHYTVDGSEPTTASPTYGAPVAIGANTTLRARGFANGYFEGAVAVGVYTFQVAQPTADQDPAIVHPGPIDVTLASATPGSAIFYRFDGVTPDQATGIAYTGPIRLAASATITARAFKIGWTESASLIASYTINQGVNAPPSFTGGADQTVAEDAGAVSVAGWATAISPGPAAESYQTVSFQVTVDLPALFAVQPAVSSAGTLTFTPAANAYGTAVVWVNARDNGGAANGGVDVSQNHRLEIVVTPVNDAPSFTTGADQVALEDSTAATVAGWATAISVGPANEAGQTIAFQVTAADPARFSVAPAIDAAGTLSFTPAANAQGTTVITVRAQDSGGVATGGVDLSPAQTFSITLTAVNDAPSFTKGADQTVLEDALAQSISGWATAIASGPANEAAQVVSFSVTSDNAALFAVAPALSATGVLSFTAAANANGVAVITIVANDDGGTANGGIAASAAQTATITVTPVNDAPSFTKGANIAVLEDAGAQSLSGWATAIAAGPANEAAQVVSFSVTTDNGALFAVAPALSPAGVLGFTPAADATGVAIITIVANDDGGVANGGIAASAAQTATITVTAVNDAPVAVADAYAAFEDTALVIAAANGVLANDIDPDDAQLLASLVAAPLHGVLDLAADGGFSYLPAAGYAGPDAFSYRTSDGAGDSDPVAVAITVASVNDAPSFAKGPDLTVAVSDGAQTVPAWATAISAGPGEGGQARDFQVTNDHPEFFAAQPAIAADGTLTFTPSAAGTALVSVRLHDNGGTANGGIDLSAVQTFLITITGGGGNGDPDPDPVAPVIGAVTIAITGGLTGDQQDATSGDHFTKNASVTVTVTANASPGTIDGLSVLSSDGQSVPCIGGQCTFTPSAEGRITLTGSAIASNDGLTVS